MRIRDEEPMSALCCARPLRRVQQDTGDRRWRPSSLLTPRPETSVGRAAALVSLFVLMIAGCGGSATSSGSTATTAVTAADANSATATTRTTTATSAKNTVAGPSATPSKRAAIDSCSLLSDDEAAGFLGGPVVSSGPTSGVGESVCQWANEQGWSIDVSVGSRGTAPRNTFVPENLFGVEPTPIPELDGSGWYIGSGTVDFAAGERHNSVLVVSSAPSQTKAEKAAEVAVLIRARIEAAS
jgi:hypothetical protein